MKKLPPDPVFTLKGRMAPIYCLLYRFSGKAELLFASTQEGKVHIWDLKSCRELNIISVGSEPCLSLNFLEDHLITQEKCGNIKIWLEVDETWTLQYTIFSNYIGFCRVQVSNHYIICPEEGSAITVRTLNGNIIENIKVKLTEQIGNIMVIKSQVIVNEQYIFIMFESGYLVLWKKGFGQIHSLKITSDCPMALDFDGNSCGIIGTSGKNLIEFFITDGFTKICKRRDIPITNAGVNSVQIHPHKLIFVAGCWDGRIRFFSMRTLKLLAVLDQHEGSIQDIVFSNQPIASFKSVWLWAAGGMDKKITLWNLYS